MLLFWILSYKVPDGLCALHIGLYKHQCCCNANLRGNKREVGLSGTSSLKWAECDKWSSLILLKEKERTQAFRCAD